MRCWSDHLPPHGRSAASATPAALLLALLTLAGCAARTSAPPAVNPSLAASLATTGSNGGVNTGGGPESIGVGVARQVRLVSGDGVAVGTSAGPGTSALNLGILGPAVEALRADARARQRLAPGVTGVPAAPHEPGRGVDTSAADTPLFPRGSD